MAQPNEITWKEFKEVINSDSNHNIVYRGHASSQWELTSTLSRFQGNHLNFMAHDYFDVLKKVLSEVYSNPDFAKSYVLTNSFSRTC